jgi:hypothetical protein
MSTAYSTNELFQNTKVLNNAKINGAEGDSFLKGQLLTADEDGFIAWDGDFNTGIDAVMMQEAVIATGTSVLMPVGVGEMNLTGIAGVNNVVSADIDKLKVAAFKSGIILN